MNDVTVRCRKCLAIIGKAIGDWFHPKVVTRPGGGQDITPALPLEDFANLRCLVCSDT
jgi:hypothetical protein